MSFDYVVPLRSLIITLRTVDRFKERREKGGWWSRIVLYSWLIHQ